MLVLLAFICCRSVLFIFFLLFLLVFSFVLCERAQSANTLHTIHLFHSFYRLMWSFNLYNGELLEEYARAYLGIVIGAIRERSMWNKKNKCLKIKMLFCCCWCWCNRWWCHDFHSNWVSSSLKSRFRSVYIDSWLFLFFSPHFALSFFFH